MRSQVSVGDDAAELTTRTPQKAYSLFVGINFDREDEVGTFLDENREEARVSESDIPWSQILERDHRD
jgi:hypothetical protein